MDVLIEGTPANEYGQKIDDQGWAFGVIGSKVSASGQVPADANGLLTSAKGIPFQLGAYDKNNAAQINGRSDVTMVVEGEYQAEKLYILGTGVNGSSSTIDITINYTDGTSSPAKRVSLNDWCDSNVGAAGNINRFYVVPSGSFTFEYVESPAKAHMYEFEMDADPSKKIASVKVANGTTGVKPTFFAITAFASFVVANIDTPADVTLKTAKTKTIETSYQLSVEKEANFEITVTAQDPTILTVSNVAYQDTEGQGTLSFDIKGLQEGQTEVVINLQNGEVKKLNTSFNVNVIVDTSVDFTEVSQVAIWPNPAKQGGVLNVQTNREQVLSLVSLQGVVLLQQSIEEGVTQIPLASIAAGTYLVRLTDTNGTSVHKIIVR